MRDYALVTIWHVDAPLAQVWDIIADVEHWSEWWTSIKRVHVTEPGGARGVGRRMQITLRLPLHLSLSFKVRVTRAEPPNLLEFTLADGASADQFYLTGSGRGTLFRYDWTIWTTSRWLDWSMPLARPIIAWFHNAAMREGRRGLAQRLHAQIETEIETGEQDTNCFCDEPLAPRA